MKIVNFLCAYEVLDSWEIKVCTKDAFSKYSLSETVGFMLRGTEVGNDFRMTWETFVGVRLETLYFDIIRDNERLRRILNNKIL